MKSEELIENYLVYTDNGIEKVHWCNVNGVKELVSPKGKVYGYVPDYFEVKRLQEQLKEAREVVKFYAKTTVGHKQKDGTYRLSIATGTINFLDPFFGMTSGMQEYVYDPRPAKKYLKKWGVK